MNLSNLLFALLPIAALVVIIFVSLRSKMEPLPPLPKCDDAPFEPRYCAYCGKHAEGAYSIHRDDWCEGPEVPLCNACGHEDGPTLREIWAKISTKKD